MLSCAACLRRALLPFTGPLAFALEAPTVRLSQRRLTLQRRLIGTSSSYSAPDDTLFQRPRRAQSLNKKRGGRQFRQLKHALAEEEAEVDRTPWPSDGDADDIEYAIESRKGKRKAPRAQDREQLEYEEGKQRERKLEEKKSREQLEWAVAQHLEHAKDPYTIAQQVLRVLRKDRPEEALLLTQEASKRHKSVVVAWNHLIDHEMRKGRLKPAVRLLNDMRRRAQRPDERTYTIIFRGCVRCPHPSLAVSEALRLYRGMWKDPQLKPNIIHLNAVMQVCGRAGDLNAMFELLSDVEDGKLMPTPQTYTAIFQSLRAAALTSSSSDVTDADAHADADANGKAGTQDSTQPNRMRQEDVSERIEQCRSVWEEVVRKWRQGSLEMDEQLACSMGRALLLDRPDRQLDVLALLHETMGLPRFDVYKGSVENRLEQAAKPVEVSASSTDLKTKKKNRGSKLQLAKPGRNTLSLIITACANLRLIKAASCYWRHLVAQHGVEPDPKLWEQMFGLLHLGRSSTEAASQLREMPPNLRSTYVYRAAMATCLRDLRNPHILNHATGILDVMISDAKKHAPDVRTLWMYLQVGQGCSADSRGAASSEQSWQKFCEDMAAGLDRVWQPYCRAADSIGLPEIVKTRVMPPPSGGPPKDEDLKQVVDLARALMSMTSKIVDVLEGKARKDLEDRRSELNRQVVVYTELVDQGAVPAAKQAQAGRRVDDVSFDSRRHRRN